MDIIIELQQILTKEKTYQEIIEQFKQELENNKNKNSKYGAFIIDNSGSMSVSYYSGSLEDKTIHKKIHIFNALEFESALNDIYNHGLFKKHKINTFEVYCSNLMSQTDFNILSFNKEQFIRNDNLGNLLNVVEQIEKLTSKFKNFDMENISEDLKEADMLNNKSIFVQVNNNSATIIKNLLLSDELKLILDTNMNYVQLTSELDENQSNNIKKIKI